MKPNLASPPSLDRLSALLQQHPVRAELFHSGELCGVTSFAAQPGRGFLHVLRRGELAITHRRAAGLPRRIALHEPSLVLYPQPLAHQFHHAAASGSDLTCASLSFEGGAAHPLVRALPAWVVLPLRELDGLEPALALLFAEADRVRCGHRLVADRLFEVVLLLLLRWLLDHPPGGDAQGVASGLMFGLADPALAKALTALHEQPGAPWSLAAMASQAGLSRSAFAARFRALVGTTPADYLADWRIALAKSHLRSGRSVKWAADTLGYANASALSRVFAQRVGMSPKAWLASAAA